MLCSGAVRSQATADCWVWLLWALCCSCLQLLSALALLSSSWWIVDKCGTSKREKLFLGLGGTISGLAAHACSRKAVKVFLWTGRSWSDMQVICVVHSGTGQGTLFFLLVYGDGNCQLMPRTDWHHHCCVYEHPANGVTVRSCFQTTINRTQDMQNVLLWCSDVVVISGKSTLMIAVCYGHPA